MVSCSGRVTEDTSVPATSVSMTMPMVTTLMYPTTVASILSGSTLCGSNAVVLNAEERSASVSDLMNLINFVIISNEEKEET